MDFFKFNGFLILHYLFYYNYKQIQANYLVLLIKLYKIFFVNLLKIYIIFSTLFLQNILSLHHYIIGQKKKIIKDYLEIINYKKI